MQSRILIEVPEMTIEEYAKKTGVSEDTIRGWIKTGKLPTYKVGKRRMVNMVARANECLAMGQYDLPVMNDRPNQTSEEGVVQ